ncbi:PTS fructose transporter subunit IIB [Halostagnicola kamekurae]|uniref:PTS system, fructose-specific IIB component n=1 Tax=Halostagnicola kamekurae TaxID=619731 RepID=A0A1I6QT85_9EURY|nr:PTS fructose transporter subunit IIB [Halostagnicola kamekurae]SFS55488.1 PTS system, fructose-specific IIB component [Halostagnicola kamekurae]
MKLVAITSCPTGIAHSQMAAENIETTAREQGHDIQVEVQGAMGAENELTADDIDDADAVIIAADTAVNQDRFDHKPVVEGTVKDGVNDAEGLIEDAVQLAEGGETGTVEASDRDAGSETGDGAGTAAENEETTSARETDTDADTKQLGGDPSKGLFARLRRLFS